MRELLELLPRLHGLFAEGVLRWVADGIDVFLVAYLVYRVLLLVRGTRAMQMAQGLGLVFVVYQLARIIGLVTLYTLLDSLLTYIVLLVVVLFQNDIRRVLARVGTQPFFRGAAQQREVFAIEEVVKAAAVMSQHKIGALIVFERDASLDEFVQQEGTTLDARPSKELLLSLFVASADNPNHDGAVVIRDGRIWQAGVFLPIAGSPKLDRSLGTRHRAAIGISEETDAVVVVVSEERGAISLCFNGNMARELDPGSLRQALLGLFQGTRKRRAAEPSGKFASGATSSRKSLVPPSIPPGALGEATRSASTPPPAGAPVLSERAKAEESTP
ncbi:MAG: diadenylate cyclase CdaA [Sandaracinus sp.]